MTTVGFWNDIEGDWSRGGEAWVNDIGVTRRDAGSRVLGYLNEHATPWKPLLRTNHRDLHPVLFAIYGDLVYHHGSAFRQTYTMLDRHLAGCYEHKHGPRAWAANRRLKRREQENFANSEKVFAEIAGGPGRRPQAVPLTAAARP